MTPDVLVIGGGLIGLSVAWRVRQQGASVTVVESARAGSQASSAAAGMLGLGFECDQEDALWDLSRRSYDLWPDFVAELYEATRGHVGFSRAPTLCPFFLLGDEERFRNKYRWLQSVGYDARLLTGSQARQLEPRLPETVTGGLLLSEDGFVDAAALTRVVAEAARESGVRLLEGRRVTSIEVESGRCTGARTAAERLSAGAVVNAAGAWSGRLGGDGAPRVEIRPLLGHVVALQTRGSAVCSQVIRTPRWYAAPRSHGRLLVGSTMKSVGFDRAVTVDGVAQVLASAVADYPVLGDCEWRSAWTAFRPLSPDRWPVLGPSSLPGYQYATGHFRHGVHLAPVTAELLAASLAGDAEADKLLAPFSPARFERQSEQERESQ